MKTKVKSGWDSRTCVVFDYVSFKKRSFYTVKGAFGSLTVIWDIPKILKLYKAGAALPVQ